MNGISAQPLSPGDGQGELPAKQALPTIRQVAAATAAARLHLPLARFWMWLRADPFRRWFAGLAIRLFRRLPGAKSALAMAVFEDGSRFVFPCYDRYWGKRLLRGQPYEPEVYALLHRLRSLPYRFLDCGANFGFWSALVSGPALGRHPALAVEADPANLAILAHTAAANGGRFAIRACAVVGRPRPWVRFSTRDGHYGRHVLGSKPWAEEGEDEGIAVEACTLEQLLAEFANDDRPILIKLDVEGMEPELFAATRFPADRDFAVLFEDHGGTHGFAATRAALARGLKVFHLHPAGLVPVRDPETLADPARPLESGYVLLALPAASGGFASALGRLETP